MNAQTKEIEIVEAMRYRVHWDFPKYRVYADGSVVSLVKRSPKRLTPITMGKYWGFTLVDHNGELRRIYHHRLVAEAFHGPCPLGHEARHKDRNTAHNSEDNLEWGTRSQNMRDKERHGTAPLGENHPMARLTEVDVLEMRRLWELGTSLPDLECRFGVTRMTCWRAATGRSWAYLNREQNP